jgi:hypothetical protein
MFYHPAKANVIADALSRKYREDEANPEEIMSQLSQQFTVVEIDELMTGGPPIMAALVVESMSEDKIKMAHEYDLELQDLMDRAKRGEANGFYLAKGGTLKTSSGRAVVPSNVELRRDILDEAHQTRYTIHPGNNKMYQDLKKKFWWHGMKKDIAEYVAQCHSC